MTPDTPLPTATDEAVEASTTDEDTTLEAEPIGIQIINIAPMENEEEE